jgi:hypothetical protein
MCLEVFCQVDLKLEAEFLRILDPVWFQNSLGQEWSASKIWKTEMSQELLHSEGTW